MRGFYLERVKRFGMRPDRMSHRAQRQTDAASDAQTFRDLRRRPRNGRAAPRWPQAEVAGEAISDAGDAPRAPGRGRDARGPARTVVGGRTRLSTSITVSTPRPRSFARHSATVRKIRGSSRRSRGEVIGSSLRLRLSELPARCSRRRARASPSPAREPSIAASRAPFMRGGLAAVLGVAAVLVVAVVAVIVMSRRPADAPADAGRQTSGRPSVREPRLEGGRLLCGRHHRRGAREADEPAGTGGHRPHELERIQEDAEEDRSRSGRSCAPNTCSRAPSAS